MRKTAFVCCSSVDDKRSLVYHETPRKASGEEFFVLFSPGKRDQENILRALYRKAISASRLGHPVQFFKEIVRFLKEMIGEQFSGDAVLSDSIIVIMIRRDDEVYLFRNRGTEPVCWNADSNSLAGLESIPGISNVPLRDVDGQGELFERSIEDHFALHRFDLPRGDRRLALTPSRQFAERYAEKLRNSMFFPAFETPLESGVIIDTDRTFAGFHLISLHGAEKGHVTRPGLRKRRLSIPIAVGAATALIAIVLTFGPFGGKEGASLQETVDQPILLSAQEANPDEEPAVESQTGETETVEPVKVDRKRTITLTEAWRKGFDGPVTSSPVHQEGLVMFGCRDGNFYAFAEDGSLKWKYTSGDGIGASPACSEGKVIGANYSGDIFCLDIESGTKMWVHRAKSRIVSSPRIRGDLVIAATMDGRVISLRLKDGTRRWSEKIGTAVWANTSIGPDYIIAATTEGTLVKLDHKGKVTWCVTPASGILSSPLCIEESNLIVFGTRDKYIYAYSLSSGDLMWRHLAGGEVNGTPIYDGASIYIGAKNGVLYSLRTNGRLNWMRKLGGNILSKPVIIDNVVFVTTYNSKLSAIDTGNGEIIKEFKADSPIYSSPAHNGDMIFFGSNGKTFYALVLYSRTG